MPEFEHEMRRRLIIEDPDCDHADDIGRECEPAGSPWWWGTGVAYAAHIAATVHADHATPLARTEVARRPLELVLDLDALNEATGGSFVAEPDEAASAAGQEK